MNFHVPSSLEVIVLKFRENKSILRYLPGDSILSVAGKSGAMPGTRRKSGKQRRVRRQERRVCSPSSIEQTQPPVIATDKDKATESACLPANINGEHPHLQRRALSSRLPGALQVIFSEYTEC